MTLNRAEQEFFNKVQLEAEQNPPTPVAEMTIEEFRASGDIFNCYAGPAADIARKDMTLPCKDGHKLQARYFQYDDQVRPILVYFPGCGYIFDLFEANSVAVSKIAKHAGCHALLVQFRLVPENPFPAAYNDGIEAVSYVAENAEQFHTAADKIMVGGFSSGGGLTAAVCNTLKDSPKLKIIHQLLQDGLYDFTHSNKDFTSYEQVDALGNKEAIDHVTNLCTPDPTMRKDPRWSPYWEKDVSGLPRTTVITSEYSGVRGQNEAYAAKLSAAGVDINKIVIPGQAHNTLICREFMSDGDDPAIVAAEAIKVSIG